MGLRLTRAPHCRRGLLMLATAVIVTLSPAAPSIAQTTAGPTASDADRVSLQRILSQVGANAVVNADFVQTRTSSLLTTPAITRGTLVFARDHGVIWQVRTPQPQGYVYGRQRSARLDGDGNVVSLDSQPSAVTRQINELADAFMHGDISGLASQFAMSVTGTANRWQVALTPTQPQIAQAVRSLTLSGDTVVRTVVLETRRGESIKWQFDKVRTTDKMDARDQRLFRAVE